MVLWPKTKGFGAQLSVTRPPFRSAFVQLLTESLHVVCPAFNRLIPVHPSNLISSLTSSGSHNF